MVNAPLSRPGFPSPYICLLFPCLASVCPNPTWILSLQGLPESMCGAPGGGLPRTPQYTLKNEGIPRRAGDAHWSAVSPSTSSEHGVWVIYPLSPDAGCVVPAHQHCKWQHGCAYDLTHWLLRSAVVREGPIPYHRWAGAGGLWERSGCGLAVKLLMV